MWVHNLNPTLLSLGTLEIRWYGLVYVLGFFLAIYWLHYLSKKGRLSLSQNEIWDLMLYLMLGVLIGSRLFELFWEPEFYLSNPLNLLKIWQGGMSFHGGFVGIVLAGWLYCRRKKLQFGKLADALSIPAVFALALGRIANFANGELVGRVWPGKWCVIFPQYDNNCRHPYVLYEGIKRFAIFGWLLFLNFSYKMGKELKPGFIFWNFVFWEGLGRFALDFFKEDKMLLGLTIGQWLSSVMVIVAIYVFFKYYKEDWKKIF